MNKNLVYAAFVIACIGILVFSAKLVGTKNAEQQQFEPERQELVSQREETIYLFGLACIHLGYSFASKGYSLEEAIAQYDEVAKEAKE